MLDLGACEGSHPEVGGPRAANSGGRLWRTGACWSTPAVNSASPPGVQTNSSSAAAE